MSESVTRRAVVAIVKQLAVQQRQATTERDAPRQVSRLDAVSRTESLLDELAAREDARTWRTSVRALLAIARLGPIEDVLRELIVELGGGTTSASGPAAERRALKAILLGIATERGWRETDGVPDYLLDDGGPLAL